MFWGTEMRRYVLQATLGALITAMPLGAAASPQGPPPSSPQAQTVPSQGYRFPSGAGILFFHVHSDRTSEFETVLRRIGEVLEATEDPARRQQAASWRIFRSLEQQPGDTVYLFVFDPAVAGADYDPVRLLGEALPTESQALYETLKNAIVRVERMGLLKIR